jgi:hypothetical protein
MRTLLKPYVQLAADQPQEARRDLDQFREGWTLQQYSIPQYMLEFVHVQLDLYLGDSAAAIRHLQELLPGLTGSLHLRGQFFRILTGDLRARVALAAAATARKAGSHLAVVQREVRLLDREKMPWGRALARLLEAGVASLRHDRVEAARRTREAIDGLEAVDMHLHAAAARRRLGELLGGGEGRALIDQADTWMTAQQIVHPVRMTRMHAPGFPELE